MPFDIQIVHPTDFVRLDAQGKLNVEQSCQVLAGLARTCVERGLRTALLDVRKIQPGQLTLAQLYLLARSFHEIGFQHEHRLAILHPYSSTEKAEFFAMAAQDRGYDVGAFDNFEEAIEWLNRPSEARKIAVQ